MIDVGGYLDQIFPFLGVRFIAVNEDYESPEVNFIKKKSGNAMDNYLLSGNICYVIFSM